MFFPPCMQRVKLSTNNKVNKKIERDTINYIDIHIGSDKNELTNRLAELNREWDTERVLEANAAAVIIISSIIGLLSNPYWFIVTGIISLFLLQHALQGWCPPLPVIRRLGVRTPAEIHEEKIAIKYLRGDFTQINNNAKDILKTIKTDYPNVMPSK